MGIQKKIIFPSFTFRVLFQAIFFGIFFFIKTSVAFSFWGSGMYGGMQSCPHGASSSLDIDMSYLQDDASIIEEAQREVREEMRENRANLFEVKREERKLFRKINSALRRYCNGGDVDLRNVPDVTETEGTDNLTQDMCSEPGTEVPSSPTNLVTCQNFVSCVKHNSGTGTGGSTPSVCGNGGPNGHGSKKFGDIFAGGRSIDGTRTLSYTGMYPNKCTDLRRGLRDFFKRQNDLKALEENRTYLKQAEKDLKADKKALLKEAKADYRAQVRDAIEFGGTESGFCFSCYTRQQRQFSWRDGLGVGLNVLMTGLGGYLGYKGFQQTVRNNTRLGYPTPPYSAAQAMFPYVANGIYGALNSAFGQGSMACGGTFGGGGGFGALASLGMGGLLGGGGGLLNGGAFGYPPGLFGGGGPGAGLSLQLGGGGGLFGPGASFMGGGMFPGAGILGGGLPGLSGGLALTLGGGAGIPGLTGGLSGLTGFPGLTGGLSGLTGGLSGLTGGGLLGLGGAGNIFGLSGLSGSSSLLGGASVEAYSEYFKQQMSYMEQQMTVRQRYMEAQMDRQRSIQGLAQEINKIQKQIQTIALSPVNYGDD